MNSFPVSHKELHRFSPSQNPAEEAPLRARKKRGFAAAPWEHPNEP